VFIHFTDLWLIYYLIFIVKNVTKKVLLSRAQRNKKKYVTVVTGLGTFGKYMFMYTVAGHAPHIIEPFTDTRLSLCLPACLSVCLSVCPPACVCLPACLAVFLTAFLPVSLFACLPFCQLSIGQQSVSRMFVAQLVRFSASKSISHDNSVLRLTRD